VKHKIKVYSSIGVFSRLWYAYCSCGWEFETQHQYPSGRSRWGRPSWEAAFALGVAHQKNAKEVCTCE
jgi:hypothetical protein